MSELKSNQMTLSALDGSSRALFPKFDAARDLVTFVDGRPMLTDAWLTTNALTVDGKVASIRVRRADCGLDCRCAGEYELIGLTEEER